MLLLLLLLQASLVHRSLQEDQPYELSANFKGGFPAGSLLTIYFRNLRQETGTPLENAVDIDLFEDFSHRRGRLHFRVDETYYAPVVSNFEITESTMKASTEEWPITWRSPWGHHSDDWWRFDLLKINDTTFLPFFKGFEQKLRTMPGVKDSFSVQMRSHNTNMNTLNYDKDDVYMTFRPPNEYTPTAETMLAAFDQAAIIKDRSKRTKFLTLDNGFPVGTFMKMSVLMRSNPSNHKPIQPSALPEDLDKNHPTIFFIMAQKTWRREKAFGIINKWENDEFKVKLYFFYNEETPKIVDNIVFKHKPHFLTKCTGDITSTDLVHVKIERPEENILKMRVYYTGTAGGITCTILMGTGDFMNGPLIIEGVQGATLLNFNKNF